MLTVIEQMMGRGLRYGFIFFCVGLSACDRHESRPEKGALVETVQLEWQTEQEHLYDVEILTQSSTGTSPLPQVLKLQAQLGLRFNRADQQSRLVAQLKNVQLLDRNNRPFDEARVLASELEYPFGAIFEQGLVTEYRSPTEATVNSLGFFRQILAALQLQAFESKSGVDLREWDATGLAKVSYSAASPASPGQWLWKKLGYEQVSMTRTGQAADNRQKVVPEIEKAEGRLHFDERGIVEVTRDEVTRVKVADNAHFRTEVKLSLKRTSGTSTPLALPSWDDLIRDTTRVPVGQGEPIKSTALVEQIKRGDLSFDEVLLILQESRDEKRSEGDVGQQATAFRALVAMLRMEPATRTAVLDAIKKDSSATPVLLDALGSSSIPFSLTVLSQFALSKGTPIERRARAASALLRAQFPNQEALDAVTELAKEPELREHGLFGLGTFTRRFREAGQRALTEEAAKRLERELLVDIQRGKPTTALLAVANSGDVRFFETVQAQLKAPQREVRDAAIQAVRLMDDARVEPLLVEVLKRNDAGDIRAALHALRPRETKQATTVNAVSQLALEHTEALVRREAVLVLKKWRSDHPEVDATLNKVRATDQDQRVLSAAG